jgi:hypothetical protein
VAPDAKLEPVIVAWIVEQAVAEGVESVIPWIVGIGKEVTLRMLAELVPPPGAGFATVSLPVPLFIRSAAERATWSDVLLM